jgi:hypothetical protein
LPAVIDAVTILLAYVERGISEDRVYTFIRKGGQYLERVTFEESP